MAAMLLVAQLGIATHPLHASGKQDGQNVEVTCAFCIAGAHWQSPPTAPAFHVDSVTRSDVAIVVRNVCAVRSLITPRLTRGPPHSAACLIKLA